MRHRLALAIALALLGWVADARATVPEACHSTVDDPPPAGGPRDHRVAQAVSSDGVHFTAVDAPELLRASVPDAVERHDGSTWVYFISGEAGQHGIHIARVEADGSLAEFDCVRLDGAFDGHAVDPNVVRLPDGRYRLFYKANFALAPDPDGAIHSAVSDDGIHFTTEGAALPDPATADPTVVQLPNGEWLMGTPSPGVVALARSQDGHTFTPESTVPINGIPELWVDGAVVHLLAGADQLRHLASTDDGATWSEGSQLAIDLPAAGGLGAPSVSGHPGAWRLFVVKVQNGGGSGGNGPCQPGDTALCLGAGRFRATATFDDGHGRHGAAHVQTLGRDSGIFWFFERDNAELLVKVLDGCAINDAHWVFAAGVTNLAVELTVEDTTNGATWVHHATGGINFPSAIDVHAFPGCDAGP